MNREEMSDLCTLAKLELEEDEVQDMMQEMEEILCFVQEICSCQPQDVPDHPASSSQDRCREDIIQQPMERTDILQNTEQSQDGFFFVVGKR